MNITHFVSGENVYTNRECIKGFSFTSALVGDKSVHFTRISGFSPLLQGQSALFSSFQYFSPALFSA